MRKFLAVVAFAAASLALCIMATPANGQPAAPPDAVELGLEDPSPPFDPLSPPVGGGTTIIMPDPDGSADVPWGDWLSEILKGLLVLGGSLALFVLRRLPKDLVGLLDMVAGAFLQTRADKLLEKAITYGINTTAGAVKGRVLTVPIGNEVIERAFEYAVRHAPGLVSKFGGLTALREMIIARLDLDEAASLPAAKPPAEASLAAG